MAVQQVISRARTARFVGQTMKVLVEGTGTDDDGRAIVVGRSYRDAPEVDGLVFGYGAADVGQFAKIAINKTTDYDLWGEIV